MNRPAAMVSPSFPFPGPPPAPSPYGQSPTANTIHPPMSSGLISPPESRRTSGDEPTPVHSTRQSLPSISEALGAADSSLPYPSHQAPPPPQTSSSYFPPPATAPEPQQRPVTTGPPTEKPYPFTFSHSHTSPYMNRAPPAVQTPHTPTTQGDAFARQGPAYSVHHPKLPALQPIKTDTSPTSSFRPSVSYASSQPSPAYETPPQTAPAAAPYGYPGYQHPSYSYAPPPPAPPPPNSAPLYPPSAALSAPHNKYPSTPARWENGHGDDRSRPSHPGATYGESVKRHLDDFDVEASLNEIAENCGRIGEFSKEYGYRANPHRTGPQSPYMPPVMTIDEMLSKCGVIDDSLRRIRSMVVSQNQAMEVQKDYPRYGQGGYHDTNGYSEDSLKRGMEFGGPDTKKRRGRAAPPGRCHSCNRAETPEWRRGPDGARTLCNACGLHYAKLTRKVGTKNSSIGGSNLRPKADA